MEQMDVPLAPMAMKSVVPMVVPIATAIGDHWIHFNGTILAPLGGDAPFTISTQSEWTNWNSNGANYANGDNGVNGDSLMTIAIH